ncbi:site-specific integrase [Pseudonocardia sp. T1-2H]|uniref:site-specific integrase n=1 Tax=Pseudonocardia sp. T1-2H TaxID=3128899 RepID=UPI0031015A03
MLAGIRRTHRTRPARVAPARPDDLRAMLSPLDPARPADARDRALLLIGFAGALRRSELAALTLADLVVDADGLRVFIAAGKTDPTATGHTRGLAYGAHPESCPVRAWRAWLVHRVPSPALDEDAPGADGPSPHSAGTGTDPRYLPSAGAFVAVDRWGRLGTRALSDRSIARIIGARADAAGLTGHWAGHSLRRGFATTGYAAGASELAIMRHGRWRSKLGDARLHRRGHRVDGQPHHPPRPLTHLANSHMRSHIWPLRSRQLPPRLCPHRHAHAHARLRH